MKIYSTAINYAGDDHRLRGESSTGKLLYWIDAEHEIFALIAAPGLERDVSLCVGKLMGNNAIDDEGITLFTLR